MDYALVIGNIWTVVFVLSIIICSHYLCRINIVRRLIFIYVIVVCALIALCVCSRSYALGKMTFWTQISCVSSLFICKSIVWRNTDD